MRHNNSHFLFIAYLYSFNSGSYQEWHFVPITLIHTRVLFVLFKTLLGLLAIWNCSIDADIVIST